MHKAKSEQCFVATSGKKVAIFQANLKPVIEDARAQLFPCENICLTSHGPSH